MSYLRRLVAKMQATTPRLVPRRSPSFGGAPGLEERDEDVVVSTRTLDAPKSEPRAAASAPAVSPIDATSAAPAPETRSDRGSAAGVTAPVVAGAPDEVTPVLTICAEGSLLTRSSAPFPLNDSARSWNRFSQASPTKLSPRILASANALLRTIAPRS